MHVRNCPGTVPTPKSPGDAAPPAAAYTTDLQNLLYFAVGLLLLQCSTGRPKHCLVQLLRLAGDRTGQLLCRPAGGQDVRSMESALETGMSGAVTQHLASEGGVRSPRISVHQISDFLLTLLIETLQA